MLKIRARWLVKAGKKQPTDDRMKAIVEDIALGLPYRLIAEKFDISLPRITQIRQLAGLPARRRH